jgi:hypothetical protein
MLILKGLKKRGKATSYTRMALYMLGNLFRTTFSEPAPAQNKNKRPRSE